MEPILIFTSENGGQLFLLFYLLSFLVCFVVLYLLGWRRKYPLHHWTLLLASGIVLFIIGTKLFSYSAEQWKFVFTHFQFPETDKITVLGGLLLLVPGIAILKWLLNFKFPVFNLVAVVIPLVMAIQRVGCLISGCCFGKPTHLPWGISYGKGHLPYHVHLDQGLIEQGENLSLAVHPNQAYHILFCMVLAYIVWRSRNYWKRPFSQFLFSISMYGIFRFFMEFLRDPAANFQAQETIWGLHQTQWLILTVILFFILVIILNELKSKLLLAGIHLKTIYVKPLLILSMLFVVCVGGEWFSPGEKIIIWLLILSVLLSNALKYYHKIILPGHRWVIPSMIILGLVFMSQQLYIPTDNTSKLVYNDYSFGAMFSEYSAEVRQFQGEHESCMGTSYSMSDPEIRKFRTVLSGFQFSSTEIYQEKRRFITQVNVFAANDRVQNLEGQLLGNETTFGLGPYFQYDGGYIGVGLGFQFGRLRYEKINKSAANMGVGDWENQPNEFLFRPQFHMRIGPYDLAYAEINIANHFPSSSPMPYNQVGFGSGLGKVDGTMVGVGYSEAGPYIKTLLPVGKKLFVGAYASANFDGGNERKQLLSLSLKFRPWYDMVPRPPKTKSHENY